MAMKSKFTATPAKLSPFSQSVLRELGKRVAICFPADGAGRQPEPADQPNLVEGLHGRGQVAGEGRYRPLLQPLGRLLRDALDTRHEERAGGDVLIG
ncbi:hypothetical protein MKK75_00020, partial [Methylobacterium sp. J-030]|uniref:hypothetical protein n=1 Tax=Methylobacterium sp. J-030 TaxID=2836627 RepID=UPI001FBA7EA6